MLPFCPHVGPREGRGEVATSNFVPLCGDPQEGRGSLPILPTFGPFLILCPCAEHQALEA